MNTIEELQEKIIRFRDQRNWAQFHNPKDVAICLSVEAAELLEVFLWKAPEQAKVERVKEELADVLYSALLLAKCYDFNVAEIVEQKLARNAEKYPVEKSWGSAKKYDEQG